MSLVKLLAYGTIGYIAYRAWQRHQETTSPALARRDDGSRTNPHGDPVLAGERFDSDEEPARPAAQASRSFGEE